jgi:hypothetical protein
VKRRLRYDPEWLDQTLFAKLPPGLDDGRTTTLHRWAQVAGIKLNEALRLAKAGKVRGYVAEKRGGQRKPRHLVRFDREWAESYGLLSALGLPLFPHDFTA